MFIPSIIRRLSLCKKSISTLPFPPISDRSGNRVCAVSGYGNGTRMRFAAKPFLAQSPSVTVQES